MERIYRGEQEYKGEGERERDRVKGRDAMCLD
jgi:hypothetical protein